MTPYVGINPIASVPDLSFEFNLGLSFPAIDYSGFEETVTIVSPQLFAVYTLDKWFVKPFAGVGLGFNVNSMDLFELNNSFSFAVKGGAKVFIPDTSFYLGGTIKFNLNQSGFDTFQLTPGRTFPPSLTGCRPVFPAGSAGLLF